MHLEPLYQLVYHALLLFLLLAAPPIFAVLVVGWISATVAGVTQTHDPVVTFVPKLVAAVVALFLFSPWIWRELVRFTKVLWTDFVP
ncbi:MAG: flagellar biosynthetic protein FliQ [Myxococcales bacterium]|nr:flagellar biosynthetic protein FliQ [Myxococcales bacterium]